MLNQLADALSKISDPRPDFEADRCLNHRHHYAGQCTACADACPTLAVSLTPTPEIEARSCLACGACSAACPSGALRGLRSVTDVWREAQTQAEQRGTVELVCRGVGAGSFDAVPIPCACALPPEWYIAARAAGIQQITIFTAECSGCPLRDGLPQADRAVQDAQTALSALGLALQVTRQPGKPRLLPAPQHAVGVSRRRFFNALVNPRVLRPDSSGALDSLIGAGMTARRALLLTALSQVDVPDGAALPTSAGNWGALVVQPGCVGCQMCAQLCPGEALAATTDADETVQLWFDAAQCSACGLCVRACFKQVLHFTPTVAVANLAISRYQSLWRGKPPLNPLKSSGRKQVVQTA